MNRLLLSCIILFQALMFAASAGIKGDKHGALAPLKKVVSHHVLTIEDDAPEAMSNSAVYSDAAIATYHDVMTRKFDFEKPDLRNTAPFITPEEYEMASVSNDNEAERKRALEVNEYVRENKRYVETFDETVILDLPVGIIKTVGNLEYTVVIEEVNMKPDGAYLDAYMVFKVPDSDKQLAFGGHGIKFSREGGLAPGAKLSLLGDHAIKIGPETLLALKGDGSTFVEWDCDGYKTMAIGAELEFSENLFIPANLNGNIGKTRVKGRFNTVVSDWNDMLVEVSIEPFQVKGLKDFVFEIKRAVFDNSSVRSVPGMSFPQGYESALSGTMWKGIYIDELSLSLPSQFNKKGSEKRTQIEIHKAIIDSRGISTIAEASNKSLVEEGSMRKWKFTVDAFQLHIVSNKIKGAGFEGEITLPIAKDKPFQYKAVISSEDNYAFTMFLPKGGNMEFDFLHGTGVEIYSTSHLEVAVKDGEFLPKAYLNGNMSIATAGGEMTIAGLEFNGLQIQVEQPYMQIGGFGIKGGNDKNKLGSFGIGINNIHGGTTGDEMQLSFDAAVSLTGKDGGSFGGEARLILVSKLKETGEAQEWVYDRLDVSKIGIDINTGAVGINGSLAWFKKDQLYGDGFRGDATLKMLEGGLTVQAVALFGRKENLRYWFADALAKLPPGMGVGAIEFKSFGGGAFYHVKQSTEGMASPLGRSISGVSYVPDESTYLKVKASIGIATAGSSSVFNGDATLSITFNQGGGVREIDLQGNGYFIQPMEAISIKGLSEKVNNTVNDVAEILEPKAAIAAHIHINYDIPNKTLHGNFEVFVNVAGVVKGIGAGSRAGWAVLHVSPEDWYIHIGSPTDPVGLQILGIIKTQSYFMVGDYIPGSPPPPDNVSEILGGIDLNYMESLNALGEGKGIAFGSRFGMDTGNLSFLMFYGRFAAGMGFDMMLKDYGQATCVGSDAPLGINGWYANGQSYGFFQGDIGIKVKLFGKNRKVEILEISAAAILQAKLPNPFWMRGIVGGNFSVMNGLVKGNCKFEIVIGEDCKIVGGSVLESIQVISQVTPNDGEREVNVFTTAQGIFNMEVGKVFEMLDLDDQKKAFRIKMDYFRLMNGAEEIPGFIKWNDQLDVVAFKPTDILPSEKQVKLQLQISFEEKKGGAWIPVVVNGKKIVEYKEISFTTDKAPDHIPAHNVAYSYPVAGQLHFHKEEYSKGYIKLISGQPELFKVGAEWVQTGRFRTIEGTIINFDFTYAQEQINFNIPAGLKNNQIYVLEIVNIPAVGTQAIDRNVEKSTTALTLTGESTTEIKSNKAAGTIEELQEKVIYSAYLQTSKYSTFTQKAKALSITNTWRIPIRPTIHELNATIQGNETFDIYEINAQERTLPLVTFEANLDIPWFKDEIKPLAYPVNYPAYGLEYTWREALPYGAPPTRAVYIRQMEEGLSLNEEHAMINIPIASPENSTIVYNLPLVMYRDYTDLRQQASIQAGRGKANDWMKRIMNISFPGINSGTTYKVKMQYMLPGINKVTSQEEINFKIN